MSDEEERRAFEYTRAAKASAQHAPMYDLHGNLIGVGGMYKLSGGYADSGMPDYLMHERVVVVGFGRSRVRVRLLDRSYTDRPELRVLPNKLVRLEDKWVR